MPRFGKILVASAKGGVGKSTTALGMAASYAEDGTRVLLLDLDTASRSLDMLMGAECDSLLNFADILRDRDLSDIVSSPKSEYPSLGFISAASMEELTALAGEQAYTVDEIIRVGVERLVAWGEYDILIADTGGGIDNAVAVADLFDLGIITSEQSKTSIRAAEYTAYELGARGLHELRLVICSFDIRAVKKDKRAGVIEMIDSSSLMCAGVVPYDKTLEKAQDKGMLPEPDAISRIAYRNIVRRIRGYDVRLFEGMKSHQRKRFLAL